MILCSAFSQNRGAISKMLVAMHASLGAWQTVKLIQTSIMTFKLTSRRLVIGCFIAVSLLASLFPTKRDHYLSGVIG